MSIYSVIAFSILSCTVGFVFACFLVAPKVADLESQIDAKKEQWCCECNIHKRLRQVLNRLEDVNAENLQLRQRAENRRTA